MKNIFATALLLMGVLSACNSQNKVTVNGEPVDLQEGIYAKFETNMGDILVKFDTENAPMTTANFVALAEGKHPLADEQFQGKEYFDSLTFHRVIPKFMIQGGDPEGTGQGGPGYQFPNETDNELTHKKGVISMANAGPNTNGSQFFITVAPTAQLDGNYSIFGEVVQGQNVADSISTVPTNQANKPNDPVIIQDVKIIRKGKAAKDFNAPEVFTNTMDELENQAEKKREERMKAQQAMIDSLTDGMTETTSGLYYEISEENADGASPEAGQTVAVHYTGKLPSGKVFDSSRQRGQPITFPLGTGRVIPGWDEGIALMQIGEKGTFVIPPHLGYGERGAGPIPPNSWLIFDVELVEITE